MYDIILRGGTIMDGSGQTGVVGDLAMVKGKIAAISQNITGGSRVVYDCRGLVVAPGFVDCQNHSDAYWQLLDNPRLDSMLLQGFTTIVVGQCGASLAPMISKKGLKPLRKWRSTNSNNIDWTSFSEFTEKINGLMPGCNVSSFTGLGTLWLGLFGEVRSLAVDEMFVLKRALESSFREGSLGLSVGWNTLHEWITSQACLPELLTSLKKHDKTLSVHLRDYGSDICNALEEVLALAREYRVHTKISHLKIQEQSNWPNFAAAIQSIERAAHDFPVGFDVYPYDTTNQPIREFLPPWLVGTTWREDLKVPNASKHAAKWIEDTYENLGQLCISATGMPINAAGKTITELAGNWHLTLGETVLEILRHDEETLVFNQCLNLQQVVDLCAHPLGAVATDGAGFSVPVRQAPAKSHIPHPRNFTASGRFLALVKERKSLNLSEAVAKLTSLPAKFVGLSKRGFLGLGLAADVVVIEPAKIQERNGFVTHVFVNGRAALIDGRLTSDNAGRYISA